MKLKHIVVGAAVLSLPFWAFALTRGQGESWSWVMATGDQVCTAPDGMGGYGYCAYVGGAMEVPSPDRTANLFADFNLDGDADWIIADLIANVDDDSPETEYETYDLTLRLIPGTGTGIWDVGQAEVVYTAECREGPEYFMDGPPGGEYWVFDPNTIYLKFPESSYMDQDRGDGPVFHVQDVNGDSYPDLILEGLTYTITEEKDDWGWPIQFIDRYNAMYTFLNTGGTGFRCAGDVDGDGETKVYDLLDLLEDWGCDNGN
ncbi:MAG: hypothetical protein GY894_03390 [Planctomycetes bacterium]|nr:hypothetical protein [Planctomycetota bacterium]